MIPYPYLTPTATATPAGQDFRRLLQQVLVGLSGLPGALVRPSWQRDPAPSPGTDVRWLALRVTTEDGGSDAIVTQRDDGADFERMERVSLAVTAYGPESETFAGEVRDGFFLPPNRYALRSEGIAFQGVGPVMHVPELFNDQWLDRSDFVVTLERVVKRSYRILPIASVRGTIYGHGPDPTLTSTFEVDHAATPFR